MLQGNNIVASLLCSADARKMRMNNNTGFPLQIMRSVQKTSINIQRTAEEESLQFLLQKWLLKYVPESTAQKNTTTA
jgi:hypothetical protein